MSRHGYTLPEVIIAMVLSSVLFGLVYAFFTPAQKQGSDVERRAQLAHVALVLSSTMERDVQGAESIELVDGVLKLERFLSRDPHLDDYGVVEIVRYSHQPGEPVQREVEIKPRPDNPQRARVDRGVVSRQRYVSVRFATRTPGPLVDVTAQMADPDPRVVNPPIAFTLQSPLIAARSYWVPNDFW